MPLNTVCLILGSNIRPEINLLRAVDLLRATCEVVAVSPIYRTPPQGYSDQADFLNMAVQVRTPLDPLAFKTTIIGQIEQRLGRVRDPHNKNAPRTIDLDIALWNHDVLDYGSKPWHIPDPDITRFAHVALPLAALAPDYIHPETGDTLLQIASRFNLNDIKEILNMSLNIPRSEHPNPQFHRSLWHSLNGEWRFSFDQPSFDRQIQVPFAFQAPLSGIGETGFHDVVWYQRDVTVPDEWAGKRVFLHFGAVDYQAWVWVNDQFATYHQGGHTPFSADITALLQPGANTITVKAEDVSTDREQPRGKQYWKEQSESIFYTRTTGIWQPVWLAAAGDTYIRHLKITPDLDQRSIEVRYQLGGSPAPVSLEATVTLNGSTIHSATHHFDAETMQITVTYPLGDTAQSWSPEQPTLYDLALRLYDAQQSLLDDVQSYFGLRKISIEGGQVRLNNQPYYMKLVLDQGYHPQGILTYPSDEAIRLDIELTKALGFNGVRKHQKVEDPRYLYWADQLGLLVWGEMANCYDYSETAVGRIVAEWQAAVERDYNHPCIVAWTPMNESWGVPNLQTDPRPVAHLLTLYHLTRSLDQTRPVISNDGWEHAQTDLLTIHDYEGSGDVLTARYATVESILGSKPARRELYVPGFSYDGAPILVTEFGGIGYQKDQQAGWGYTSAVSDEDFIQRYEAVVKAILSSAPVQGFCYTQLTDVEQEINGLLTYDRQPKVDPEIIRRINNLPTHPWPKPDDQVQ